MRKLIAVAVAAVIAATVLVASAGARDVPVTLNLIAKTTSGHPLSPHRFAFSGVLFKAGDRTHQKGHYKAVANDNNRLRAVAYLRNGKIKVDGHGNHVRIIAGTRHWAGATGSLDIDPIGKNTARLTFHVE